MNYRTVLALALFSWNAAVLAASPCEEKAQEIEKEIRYAELHQNQGRIDGLKKALSQVRANCRDGHVIAEHRQKVAQKQAEVAERRAELHEASQKGDADKIAKRRHKLAEAEQELKALKAQDY
ncbi:DUF1090 domain-containing protein [Cronobacter turicensis]|uniref:DUF1090 domain-containing protein n=1 Tax=Cronobacter turicensis TaxID=413502 RepID=UPI0024C235B8|nr:DUF1090 domain-containing protein [Cronobacter turicensis]ELY5847872.1 DUF1090 domain-containing protein [Cronobacter turicensis]MDK1335178.1 DUF1090 domain-containing protein [Cronobacter turicensis]